MDARKENDLAFFVAQQVLGSFLSQYKLTIFISFPINLKSKPIFQSFSSCFPNAVRRGQIFTSESKKEF